MHEKNEKQAVAEDPVGYPAEYKIGLFLVASLATYGLLRKGHYRASLNFYPRAGGGGLNFYKQYPDGVSRRFFGIDYHPFWNKHTQQKEWQLHYHRGNTAEERRKHRPQDGW